MPTLVMHTTHTATGFACCCDLLPGWTTSHGHNFEKFDKYVRESVEFYVKCAREDGDEYPEFLDDEYEIIYDFDVCGLLNYYQGILSFAGLQKITGVNQKQLAHYAAGRSKPRRHIAQQIMASIQSFGTELQKVSLWTA